MEIAKNIGYDSLKMTGSVIALNMSGLPTKMRSYIDNPGYLYLVDGSLYTMSKAIVDMSTNGKSVFQSDSYINVLDDVGYMSLISAGTNNLNIQQNIYNTIDKTAPNSILNDNLKMSLTDGLIISSASALGNVLDVYTGDNEVFNTIRRPVSSLLGKLQKE